MNKVISILAMCFLSMGIAQGASKVTILQLKGFKQATYSCCSCMSGPLTKAENSFWVLRNDCSMKCGFGPSAHSSGFCALGKSKVWNNLNGLGPEESVPLVVFHK